MDLQRPWLLHWQIEANCVTVLSRIHKVHSWGFKIPKKQAQYYLLKLFFVLPASRVTGEVKHNITNTVVCRVQGEWNSVLEFAYSSGETKYVDLTKLAVTKKRVRPLEKQDPFESRCVILASIRKESESLDLNLSLFTNF